MTAALALPIVVDVSVALAIGLLVCRVLRRRPAALRHWVLAASLVVAAAAPVLEVTLPRLELPVLGSTASVTTSGPTFSDGASSAPFTVVTPAQDTPRTAWVLVLVAAWAIGCVALLVSLLAGLARLTWMTRRCRPLRSSLWRERAAALSTQYRLRRTVVVVESPDRALLVTWGLMRPRIIVPATAVSWSAERIDMVLGHELAHIVRCDWAVQVTAEVLRAVHWFNPLMWLACRQLRVESEHACDDAVLRRGVEATDYASHLLAIARHVLAARGGWASAPAVAHASTLERRIAAMLNPSPNRKPVTRTARLAALIVTLALTVPVVAATLTERVEETSPVSGAGQDIPLTAAPAPPPAPVMVEQPAARRMAPRPAAIAPAEAPEVAPAMVPVQEKPASVSGTIRDSQGGVMPGVEVAVTNNASETSGRTVTDSNGAFRFRDLAPGQYRFVARLPGFRTATDTLDLAAGQDLRHDRILPIGQLAETIVVTCRSVDAALHRNDSVPLLAIVARSASLRLFPRQGDGRGVQPALAAQVVPVRIGGNIKAPTQVKKVPPRCPAVTPGAGLIVILEAAIGVDGLVRDAMVLRPQPADDKQIGYVQAAMDAVRQWEYTPTLLNNVPTAIIMTVTVTFTVTASPN